MGRKNPFTVPEGYFEQLTAQIMDKLPQAEVTPLATNNAKKPAAKLALIKQLRPWLYAAACTALAVMLGVSYFFMQSPATSTDAAPMAAVTPATNIAAPAPDNSYIDEVADYVMMDNAEIYACLSENY